MLRYFDLKAKPPPESNDLSWKRLFAWSNFFTLGRLLLLYPVAVFFVRDDYIPVILLLVLFNFLDVVDGHVARISNNVTVFGRYFDTAADKLSWLLVIALAWWQQLVPGGILALVLFSHLLHPVVFALYRKKTKKAPPRVRLQIIVAVAAALAPFFSDWQNVLYVIAIVTNIHYIYYLATILASAWGVRKRPRIEREISDAGWYFFMFMLVCFFVTIWFYGEGISRDIFYGTLLAVFVAVFASLFAFAHPSESIFLPLLNGFYLLAIIIALWWAHPLSWWMVTLFYVHIILYNKHHFWHMWFAGYPPYEKN